MGKPRLSGTPQFSLDGPTAFWKTHTSLWCNWASILEDIKKFHLESVISLSPVSHWVQKRRTKIHTAHQLPSEFIELDVATEFWKYLLIPKVLIPLRGHEALCQASQNDVSLWLAATSILLSNSLWSFVLFVCLFLMRLEMWDASFFKLRLNWGIYP